MLYSSVTTPIAAVRFRARGVFIFVRNFSCGIFLREIPKLHLPYHYVNLVGLVSGEETPSEFKCKLHVLHK